MRGLKTEKIRPWSSCGVILPPLAGVLALCAALWLPALWAQPLPGGATPGGALPVPPTSPPLPPSPADLEPFPVPPAVERPLDSSVGERLFVARFDLQGAVDHPQAGVRLADLKDLVEDMRREHLGLVDVDDNGFTAAERERISEVVRGLVDAEDADRDTAALEALIQGLRQQRYRRLAGMTIGQIQEVAAALTERYRSAGFILAQAIIPTQEVDDGVVTIDVFEGKLGTVVFQGNEMYRDAVLAAPFADLIDAPVTAAGIESAILTTSDYPGISVFGVFQPGTEVGETVSITTSDVLTVDKDPVDTPNLQFGDVLELDATRIELAGKISGKDVDVRFKGPVDVTGPSVFVALDQGLLIFDENVSPGSNTTLTIRSEVAFASGHVTGKPDSSLVISGTLNLVTDTTIEIDDLHLSGDPASLTGGSNLTLLPATNGKDIVIGGLDGLAPGVTLATLQGFGGGRALEIGVPPRYRPPIRPSPAT